MYLEIANVQKTRIFPEYPLIKLHMSDLDSTNNIY